MKYFKFSFLLFFICNVYSQSGNVIYKKNWINAPDENKKMEELQKNDPRRYNMMRMIKQKRDSETQLLEYELKFNNQEAVFAAKELLSIDNNNFSGLALGPSNGIYYNNLQDGEKLWKTDEYFNRSLIIILDEINWELKNETKMVGGYLCRRAVGSINYSGKPKRDIEAWYAPEIPVNFGPLGYSNLPGLILDLTTDSEHYYVKEINFNSQGNMEIVRPSKGEKITYSEFVKMSEEAVTKFKKN